MLALFHRVAGAPDPVAPFSHAVEVDGWVFVTGQMPFTGTSIDAPYPRDERFRTSATYAAFCRQVSEAFARAMTGNP